MKELYDLESYSNFFCVGIENFITQKKTYFEISEERNDLHLIYKWFYNYNGFLISFNGIHYDNMMIKYLIHNYKTFCNLSWQEITLELKQFNDKIIHENNPEEIKYIKYMKQPWTDIDLYLYWSKGLRISKKISLKALGIQLGYPVVQELPFKPDHILKKEELPMIREYNTIHDLGILRLLTAKMEEDIKLRGYIKSEYGLECWSYDAPKIASEYLLEYYCSKTWNQQQPYWKYKKEIRNTKYIPKVWLIRDYLPEVNFKTDFFKNIYKKIQKGASNNPFSLTIPFHQENHSVRLSISQGGIHSVNDNQHYKENEDDYLIDADIAGLYPTLFRKYRFLKKEYHIILDKYVEMIDDRTIAKRNGDKKKDTFLKLCNNAFSGLVDSPVTWLYSPEHILALRIFGQLIQLRFMEELNFHNISVLFTNTDGTLVRCPKDKLHIYHQIANNIAKEFQVEWEFAILKQICFVNTNSYLSEIKKEYMIDENCNEINVKDKGKIKRKGSFFRQQDDIPLGDAVNELVISKALEAYYINNISPSEFISNPEKYNLHIYDYCKSNKIDKSFTVYHDNKIQQNLNRYYFSKNSPFLFKRKHDIGTFQHVNVGEGVKIFNNFEQKEWKDYEINYQYYISKTQEIIDKINNLNQLTLF